jgi:hypothetical protein
MASACLRTIAGSARRIAAPAIFTASIMNLPPDFNVRRYPLTAK